ncbi:MAG TPA: hypothetical protein VKF37_05300, partial [Chloroflexota bacterium]|nr:hypothetical protein [Chloroflexota bacterium]
VSAYGGTGTIPGVVLALVLLSVLEAGLGVAGLSGQEQTISVGLLLVVAIGGGHVIRAAQGRTRWWPWQQRSHGLRPRPLDLKEEAPISKEPQASSITAGHESTQ